MGGILSHSTSDKRKPSKAPKKKVGGTISNIDRAILDLKISRDRLTIYQTKLASDSEVLAARAKTLYTVEGKTKTALQLLRLRKYKLQQADRVADQLLTVLHMVDKIVEKQNEQEVVVALRSGTNALQKLHDEIGIDEILNLMDTVRDQNEVEQRINEALGQGGIDVMDETAEEEAILELEKLQNEEARPIAKQGKTTAIPIEDKQISTEEATDLLLPIVPQTSLSNEKDTTLSEPILEKIAIAV